jgi:hypothetical protein
MDSLLSVRDLVWCVVVGVAIGAATLLAERWLTAPPPPLAADPAADDVWRVLDEARRITIQAARDRGH